MFRRTSQSPQLAACVDILAAADRVRVRVAALIGPHGLTLSQYNTLRILRGANESLPIMEVRRRLIERTPGITRLVDGLERKGLVKRCPSSTDRRATLCEITAAGLKRLRELDKPLETSDQAAMADLSTAEVTQLTKLLRRVR